MVRVRLREHDEAGIRELLLGHKVTKVLENVLVLDNGATLQFEGNMGCAGCASGNYELSELNGADNVITAVNLVNDPAGDGYEGSGIYRIFVVADHTVINLATFEGTDGNGWYGTGYTIDVSEAP